MTSKKVEVAKKALIAGSYHVLNLFGKSMNEIGAEYKPKDGDTPRTLIDTNAQAEILRAIQGDSEYANDRFNAEEAKAFGSGDRVWYIDPYDGTSNAQIILPMSTMGIGIVEKGEHVASIILNPFEQKLFYAEKGQGAQLEELAALITKQPYIIKTSSLKTDIKSNKAATRYAWIDALFNKNTTERKTAWIRRMMEAGLIQNVRMTGSNIDYSAKIAEGRGHYQLTDAVGGYFDLCGFNLIEEAGGKMVNLEGKQPTPKDQVAIAVANSVDLETVLRITQDCYKDYNGFR